MDAPPHDHAPSADGGQLMSASSSAPQTKQTCLLVLGLLAVRMIGMVLVVMALPVSHLTFGKAYHGDGQQAAGFIVSFWVIGMAATIVYTITATIAHALASKKSLKFKIWLEIAVLLAFVGILAYAGITAHYH